MTEHLRKHPYSLPISAGFTILGAIVGSIVFYFTRAEATTGEIAKVEFALNEHKLSNTATIGEIKRDIAVTNEQYKTLIELVKGQGQDIKLITSFLNLKR
jgi:hypothetical protein